MRVAIVAEQRAPMAKPGVPIGYWQNPLVLHFGQGQYYWLNWVYIGWIGFSRQIEKRKLIFVKQKRDTNFVPIF